MPAPHGDWRAILAGSGWKATPGWSASPTSAICCRHSMLWPQRCDRCTSPRANIWTSRCAAAPRLTAPCSAASIRSSGSCARPLSPRSKNILHNCRPPILAIRRSAIRATGGSAFRVAGRSGCGQAAATPTMCIRWAGSARRSTSRFRPKEARYPTIPAGLPSGEPDDLLGIELPPWRKIEPKAGHLALFPSMHVARHRSVQ